MEDKIEANMGLVVSVVNSFNPKSDEEREEYIQVYLETQVMKNIIYLKI